MATYTVMHRYILCLTLPFQPGIPFVSSLLLEFDETESSGQSSAFGTESDRCSPFSHQSGVVSSPPQDPLSIQQRLNQHQHKHGNHSSPNSSGTSDVCLGGWDPAGAPLPAPGVRVCDVDLVGAGMDFVLTIERPCLDHLHGDPTKPDEPDGHALTVSSCLITASTGSNNGNGQGNAFNFSNPSSTSSWPAQSPSQPACGMMCQDVPTAVMDNLLNLSGELVDSDHEVTPVQAWHYIRSRPQFDGLEVGVLSKFASKLRDAVKCHGCVRICHFFYVSLAKHPPPFMGQTHLC
ncbi:hypothetical protein MCOR25_003197 [Pyricularia grisea]|nr:hypothetical protein MCOR25_003197 [Pyricularia grisea]